MLTTTNLIFFLIVIVTTGPSEGNISFLILRKAKLIEEQIKAGREVITDGKSLVFFPELSTTAAG